MLKVIIHNNPYKQTKNMPESFLSLPNDIYFKQQLLSKLLPCSNGQPYPFCNRYQTPIIWMEFSQMAQRFIFNDGVGQLQKKNMPEKDQAIKQIKQFNLWMGNLVNEQLLEIGLGQESICEKTSKQSKTNLTKTSISPLKNVEPFSAKTQQLEKQQIKANIQIQAISQQKLQNLLQQIPYQTYKSLCYNQANTKPNEQQSHQQDQQQFYL